MHVLLQYQSKSYYIIGQEVYYSIGRFITLSGSYYIIGRFLLHYRAVITVSGVYYIIGWYNTPRLILDKIDTHSLHWFTNYVKLFLLQTYQDTCTVSDCCRAYMFALEYYKHIDKL